jgi:hypothetical protein
MNLTLIRDKDDGISTVGRLIARGHQFCQIIERPWVPHDTYRAGTPNESCIPAGTYGLQPHQSPKYGDCYAIENPDMGVHSHIAERDQYGQEGDRWGCLIHPANWAYQLQGCLAPGEDRLEWKNTYMVTRSRDTYAKLFELLSREDINVLEIRDLTKESK